MKAMWRVLWATVVAGGLWTPAGAGSYEELLAKALKAEGYAKEGGKALAAPQPPAKPHQPTKAEIQAGLVVFAPRIAEPFADRVPAAEEVPASVEVRAALGETESLLLAVHALKDQRHLGWSVQGELPAGVRVEFLPVVMAPMADRGGKYSVTGLWLATDGAVDVPAGASRAWLARVHMERSAKAGEHTIAVSLAGASAAGGKAGATLRLRVLPFELADPFEHKYVFGAFCGGADFSDAQYAGMKAHGLDAILWFWGHYGLKIENVGGKLRLDTADLDATIGRFQKAGLRGPIDQGLGNDSCGHIERAVCQAFNLPMQPEVKRDGKEVKLAVLDNPRIEELMVEALRQLFDHARTARWPEIVILPYDEPTERLMDEHRRMVRLFRKHFPKVRLYGVTMNRLSWAKMLLDSDILVSNGDFARIRSLADENRKSLWLYGSAATANGFAGCRWRFGLSKWAFRTEGSWFWCYNFYVADPWNEFDGFTPDSSWVICWPALREGGDSVETLAYEGLREGVDDVRYALTLDAALAKAGSSPIAQETARAYNSWREGLQASRPGPAEPGSYRDALVAWILAVEPSPAR